MPPRPVVIEQAAEKERAANPPHVGPNFIPERWLSVERWRCQNGHVCNRYRRDRNPGGHFIICWKCLGQIWRTFPEDTETKPARKRPAK